MIHPFTFTFAMRRNLKGITIFALFSVMPLFAVAEIQPGATDASAGTAPAGEGPEKPDIDPRADELLRAASQYLAQAKAFTVSAEIWQDTVLRDGRKVQGARTVDLQMRRPDKLHAEVRSAIRNRDLWYDGKNLTILDRDKNFYGTLDAPETLDKTIDFVEERFGINLPLGDLMISDPYASAIRNVQTGDYLGLSTVLGVQCHHLGFTQDAIDWQIWIEAGAKPLIRKVIITYKDEPQAPQFTAILKNWELTPPIPDQAFVFTPPPKAQKIGVWEYTSADETSDEGRVVGGRAKEHQSPQQGAESSQHDKRSESKP
jgi:hypothetical protein